MLAIAARKEGCEILHQSGCGRILFRQTVRMCAGLYYKLPGLGSHSRPASRIRKVVGAKIREELEAQNTSPAEEFQRCDDPFCDAIV